ncbi:MAG: hypothetical protein PHW11_03915 [Anaerolineaceae bacterium]|jgi:hypothetical protein|nr:hypothetical protein [Anaerolineaceae bacterium]MDD4042637.1 hypothetical protein [Anaerolineaceae bacterium]MDD4577812.1 hypothetical protein [Anaerolineaceae bacterium]
MNQNVKTITLIVGTLLGAFLGYRAALNFIQTSEDDTGKLPITASQGLQVGLTAVTALKQIGKISRNQG